MSDLLNTPPHNTFMEHSVLQCIITRATNRAMYLTHLDPLHFYDRRHAELFSVCRMLWDRESALDSAILDTELATNPRLAQACGGRDYVITLAGSNDCLSPYGARVHIRQLREMAKDRRDLQIGQELTRGNIPQEKRVKLAHELAAPSWSEKTESNSTGALFAANEMWSAYEETEARVSQGIRWKGLDCGFEPLNDHLSGLCPGELTVIAGRSGMGKSTLAVQMGLAVSQQSLAPVGYISLEMTRPQICERFCGIMASVHPGRIRRGTLEREERDRLQLATSAYAELPINIFTDQLDIHQIKSCVHDHPEIKLWIIDHLQRIAGGNGENEHLRLGGITKDIGNLSLTHDRHFLLLSQLNRQCESRQDRMPQISDLRGSGSIEEDAVNVLLIYRPGYYKEIRDSLKDKPEELEDILHSVTIFIEKSRFEGPGARDLRWRPEIAAFANPYYGTEAP